MPLKKSRRRQLLSIGRLTAIPILAKDRAQQNWKSEIYEDWENDTGIAAWTKILIKDLVSWRARIGMEKWSIILLKF